MSNLVVFCLIVGSPIAFMVIMHLLFKIDDRKPTDVWGKFKCRGEYIPRLAPLLERITAYVDSLPEDAREKIYAHRIVVHDVARWNGKGFNWEFYWWRFRPTIHVPKSDFGLVLVAQGLAMIIAEEAGMWEHLSLVRRFTDGDLYQI